MASDQKFEFNSLQDKSSIKAFLESLLDGFENGKIVLSSNAEEIVLHPATLLRFDVKAKKKEHRKSQISIKISWTEPKIEIQGANKQIRISS